MERLSTLAFSLLTLATAQAQTSDIVVFSDMGEKFTLVIDGDVKNETPAARVVATGIKNATPLVVVRFADAGIAPIKQNGWMEAGKEYTLRITTNKKGEHVLRMQGQAELGSAAAVDAIKPNASNFVEDGTQPGTEAQTIGAGGVQSTSTTTVTQSTQNGTGDQNVNMSMGVNGVGVNMNMGVTDGTGAHTTNTTTSTTTTTTSHTMTGQSDYIEEKPTATHSRTAYSMPGYNGPIGCDWPMSGAEFDDAKKSIENKGFEESKMTLAKQIAGGHCMTVDQVKGVMGLFGFEDSKLDFAKFAYGHTYDLGNYYKVNDAFGFESSIDELNKYIQSR